jgi:hypothetical protein
MVKESEQGKNRTMHSGRSDRQHMDSEIVNNPRGHAIIMCVAGVGLGWARPRGLVWVRIKDWTG